MDQSATDAFPAVGLVATGAVSVQFGAAYATRLFSSVGPAGAATLRLVIGAAVLMAVSRGRRPRHRSSSDLAVMVGFGLALAAMNLSFYEAIDRIPLGVAVTLEFAGPLTLALAASRRWSDGLWAVGAGSGVILLASGGGRLNPAGIVLALVAGTLWVGYILLGRETGRRCGAVPGLTWAMAAGGIALLPWGMASGGSALLRPGVAGLGVVVALLSSVIPYTLEMLALRRVTARAFGVMISLDPAMAAAAGLVVLNQHLALREWVALGLVVGANAGNSVVGRRPVTGEAEAAVVTGS